MRKFEAPTLEEAYAAAAKEFSCSVTELDIQVVQNPSRGFLGFGRRSAIIVADSAARKRSEPKPKAVKNEEATVETPPETVEKSTEEPVEEASAVSEEPVETTSEEKEPTREEAEPPTPQKESEKDEIKVPTLKNDDEIFGNFYTETPDISTIVVEIENKINELFAHACFEIERIVVSAYDDETVLVEFNGSDAALLIGKEGYRYKALAHLLYNWIHGKYGFKVRLEIAEFLQNQEMMIENYLQPIIERVENEGRAQTKVLDGILVQIALKNLRGRFPDKYVAVRTNKEGGRYIIINEFLEKK